MVQVPDWNPFYAPFRRPAPPRTPTPGEPLFEFLCGHDRMRCELRDHGDYGIEAQFFQNEEFLRSRRFETRALAVQLDGDQAPITTTILRAVQV